MDSQKVNDALNEAIFGGRSEGKSVYITLGAHARKLVSEKTGFPMETLEEDVVEAASSMFDQSGNPYKRALSWLSEWQENNYDTPPPYTGVLYCLARAAERMDDADGISEGNYYDRLEQVVGIPRDQLQKHTRNVAKLWGGLNEWLGRSGYQYGRPTAVPFKGAWVYVGYALSQAVVRASDRKHFINMFTRYGFVPGEAATERDISPFIDDWLSKAGAPSRLKRRWSQAFLRPRIAQAALDSLSEWDGVPDRPSGLGQGAIRLSLGVSIGGFPAKVSVKLGLQKEVDKPIEGLQQVGAPPKEGGFSISNAMSGTFASVSPAEDLSAPQILKNGIKLQCTRGETYAYFPNDVVPLLKSASGGLWRSVNRARFGELHSLLVRDDEKTRAQVDSILLEVADFEKCSVATPSVLSGIPKGWVLYRDVLIQRCARGNYSEAVAVLDPLDDDSALTIDGGLRLGHGIWHSQVPFQVRLIAKSEGNRVEVFEDNTGVKSSPLISKASQSGQCIFSINPEDLGEADRFIINAYSPKKRLVSKRIMLRSANKPRPLSLLNNGSHVLGYLGLSSAKVLEPADIRLSIRGFDSGDLSAITGTFEGCAESWKEMQFVAEPCQEEYDGEEALSHSKPSEPVIGDGSTRHVHVWQCEPFDGVRSRTAPMSMECSECGHSMIMRNRGKKTDLSRKAKVRVFEPFITSQKELAARELDQILDALCFLGSGSWSRFYEIVSQFADDALIIRKIAETFAALGFIDVELEKGSARIRRWCVCPPQLVVTARGYAFLAGFRSAEFVKNFVDWAEHSGARIEFQVDEGQPTQIYVHDADVEILERLSEKSQDPFGRGVTVIADAASNLAFSANLLETVESELVSITVGQNEKLQKFDLPSARWRNVDRIDKSGAYRLDAYGRMYFWVDCDGRTHAGPYQLVKTIAAHQQGLRLHDFNEATSEFVSVPGAEPPIVLVRALVACSGKRPQLQDGYTVYKHVTAPVALSVMKSLYGEGIPQ